MVPYPRRSNFFALPICGTSRSEKLRLVLRLASLWSCESMRSDTRFASASRSSRAMRSDGVSCRQVASSAARRGSGASRAVEPRLPNSDGTRTDGAIGQRKRRALNQASVLIKVRLTSIRVPGRRGISSNDKRGLLAAGKAAGRVDPGAEARRMVTWASGTSRSITFELCLGGGGGVKESR
jgi:hypothetical protein